MNLSDYVSAGLLLGFIVAFICSVGIVLTTKWHGKLTLDGLSGVQKFHLVPTPRVGGVAIAVGLVVACLNAEPSVQELLVPVLVAGLPAFCFGVAEDLTKRVSVRARLLATMASGVCAWAMTGVSITSLGLWGVDTALSFVPLSVLFTAFAVGGIANAVNIIDGFNGLASGTVTLCLVALGMIALGSGDIALASLSFAVAAVTIGFFLVNFPFGKLFLGDGGAYLLGFLLAWIAVMLPARNPEVSVWAPLLACAYPVFETVFTIVRRAWTKSHPGQPDSHHLHSLVMVVIAARFFPNLRADLRNASVSPFSWVIATLPAVLAVIFPNSVGTLMLSFALCFGVYLGFYWYLALAVKSQNQAAPQVLSGEVVDPDEVRIAA